MHAGVSKHGRRYQDNALTSSYLVGQYGLDEELNVQRRLMQRSEQMRSLRNLCAGIKPKLMFSWCSDSIAWVLYNEGMEDTPPPGEPDAFRLPRFDPDFKPMYALTEPQYQVIINQMANLVFATIEQFKHSRQGQQIAQQLAANAYDILRNYDDDMAEIMLVAGQPPQHRVHRGSS